MGVTLTGTLEIILPKPTSIYRALVSGFFAQPVTSRASYIFHLQQSFSQILAGYVVGCTLGLLLAMVSVRFAIVEFVLRPFVVALQSMPKIADVPGMFSVLIILAFVGWLLSMLLAFLRRRIVYWAPEQRARGEAKQS